MPNPWKYIELGVTLMPLAETLVLMKSLGYMCKYVFIIFHYFQVKFFFYILYLGVTAAVHAAHRAEMTMACQHASGMISIMHTEVWFTFSLSLSLSVYLFVWLPHALTLSHCLSLSPSVLHSSLVAVREPSQLSLSSQFQEKLLSWHLKLICKLGLDQFGAVGALLWHWHWPPIMLSCWLHSSSVRNKPNALCGIFQHATF